MADTYHFDPNDGETQGSSGQNQQNYNYHYKYSYGSGSGRGTTTTGRMAGSTQARQTASMLRTCPSFSGAKGSRMGIWISARPPATEQTLS